MTKLSAKKDISLPQQTPATNTIDWQEAVLLQWNK